MNLGIGGKPVLVTGAGGFIGSHLTEYLVREGAKVRAFVRYTSRRDIGMLRLLPENILAEVDIVEGDLRDPQAVNQAMEGKEIVFHLGALISIPYSYRHPREVVETNVLGTFNVLQAGLERQIGRVIHTSTSEVYGTAVRVPMDESHPLQAQSPYSASKIGADKLAESFFDTYDLPVVTIRPFNTFGPRQSARAVIPTIITQALTSDTIRLGTPDTLRDFTYVSDTVNGFIKAATAANIAGMTLNLGTGREIRIGDLVDLIVQLVGRKVDVALDSQRLRPSKSEVRRLLSDNSQARDLLGWNVEVPLEKGVQMTIEWIRKNIEKFRVGEYEF